MFRCALRRRGAQHLDARGPAPALNVNVRHLSKAAAWPPSVLLHGGRGRRKTRRHGFCRHVRCTIHFARCSSGRDPTQPLQTPSRFNNSSTFPPPSHRQSRRRAHFAKLVNRSRFARRSALAARAGCSVWTRSPRIGSLVGRADGFYICALRPWGDDCRSCGECRL